MKPNRRDLLVGAILGLALLLSIEAEAANDFSAAEQAIFMDDQLGSLKPPLTLKYKYRKTGTLEAPFEDSVEVMLAAQPDGSCCAASARFLTGARQLAQIDVGGARANPATLYFLERDIREMERLTQGKANYFRKRIRMAVYQGATIRNLMLPYRGRPVAVREVSIAPYVDDPNRARYDKLAAKRYLFLLSAAVPGGLYGIRTRIDAEATQAAPLIAEEMLLDGAEPEPAKRQP